MHNPIKIYLGKNIIEEYVMIQGYVKSVTYQLKGYNSVSFLVDSEDTGNSKAPLISVMCFENKYGINFKQLTDNTVGRFLTCVCQVRHSGFGISYKAVAVSIAPREFKEASNPINDSEVQISCDDDESEEDVADDERIDDFSLSKDEEVPF